MVSCDPANRMEKLGTHSDLLHARLGDETQFSAHLVVGLGFLPGGPCSAARCQVNLSLWERGQQTQRDATYTQRHGFERLAPSTHRKSSLLPCPVLAPKGTRGFKTQASLHPDKWGGASGPGGVSLLMAMIVSPESSCSVRHHPAPLPTLSTSISDVCPSPASLQRRPCPRAPGALKCPEAVAASRALPSFLPTACSWGQVGARAPRPCWPLGPALAASPWGSSRQGAVPERRAQALPAPNPARR